jgi:hypothetical protein
VTVRAYLEASDEFRAALAEAAERGAALSIDCEEEFFERLSDIWDRLTSEEQTAIDALLREPVSPRRLRPYRARLLDLLVARSWRLRAALEPWGTPRHRRCLRIAELIEGQRFEFWGGP